MAGFIDYKNYRKTYIVAGENLVAGNIIYLKVADGKYYKAQADDYATCSQDILYCNSEITADGAGYGYEEIDITGTFSVGSYYISESTAGLLTTTAPSTIGQYIVELGTASSTVFRFRQPQLIVGL